MLQHILGLSLILAFCFSTQLMADETATPRPNIVVILADDLGYSDLGCYGGEIPTPNIDRLAGAGVRFTQFYNNARCCPSRASLLTGRYPHQVGIGAMIDPYAKWIREAANTPAYSTELSKESPTMAELLRGAGYHAMMVGKWHLGNDKPDWPSSRGFDRTFALVGGAMNYYGSDTKGGPPLMELNGETYVPPKEGFFATEAFTDHAVQFLKEAKEKSADKPFFLYLPYNAPHWPLHARPEEIAKFKGKYQAGWQAIREKRYERMRELGVIDGSIEMAPMDRGNVKAWEQLTDAEREEWDLRMAIYAAMVELMDTGVGKVMETLREMGVEENTLVLFLSDNGGAAEDPHRGEPGAALGTRDSFWGYARPWATVSCSPFRYHKVTAYEGGISAPLVAHWPAGIPKDHNGQFVREPAHLIDLLPTFLDLAGAKPDASFKPEGENIATMIKGGQGNPDRTFGWEHEGQRGFRKGKWKLVRLSDKAWELFDMESDRAEQNNLAAEHPELVAELEAGYTQWADRVGVVAWEEIVPHRPAPKK